MRYIFPATLGHVTVKPVVILPLIIAVSAEFGLFGLVRAWNSCRFVRPSPSGSQAAQEELLVVVPLPPKFAARHQSDIPSPTESKSAILRTEIAEMRAFG